MNENGPWTIGELSALVLRVLHSSGLLEADYAGQPNGRVSSIPQERTIRWYASIGLLDKPLTMRGRTALYGRRHLCQLVAIKRLQAQGRSVAQVQEDLLGATDATLEGIAHLPKELLDATAAFSPAREAVEAGSAGAGVGSSGAGAAAAAPAAARAGGAVAAAGLGAGAGRGTRTARRAAAAAEGAQGMESARGTEGGKGVGGVRGTEDARGVEGAHTEGAWGAHGPRNAEGAGVVPAVRLGSGVTLLLGAATRPVDAEDLERLEEAAGPLLALLRGRGLDGPDPEGTRDEHTS